MDALPLCVIAFGLAFVIGLFLFVRSDIRHDNAVEEWAYRCTYAGGKGETIDAANSRYIHFCRNADGSVGERRP